MIRDYRRLLRESAFSLDVDDDFSDSVDKKGWFRDYFDDFINDCYVKIDGIEVVLINRERKEFYVSKFEVLIKAITEVIDAYKYTFDRLEISRIELMCDADGCFSFVFTGGSRKNCFMVTLNKGFSKVDRVYDNYDPMYLLYDSDGVVLRSLIRAVSGFIEDNCRKWRNYKQ